MNFSSVSSILQAEATGKLLKALELMVCKMANDIAEMKNCLWNLTGRFPLSVTSYRYSTYQNPHVRGHERAHWLCWTARYIRQSNRTLRYCWNFTGHSTSEYRSKLRFVCRKSSRMKLYIRMLQIFTWIRFFSYIKNFWVTSVGIPPVNVQELLMTLFLIEFLIHLKWCDVNGKQELFSNRLYRLTMGTIVF